MINDVQTVAVAYQGDSLPVEGDILCSMLRQGDVVIDVGANCGSLVLAFASKLGGKGKIFALEPQPIPYQCLIANIALNSLCHMVIPLNVAAGKEAGEIDVPNQDPFCDNFGGCSLVDKFTGPVIPTPLITVDSMQVPRCNLLKIDIEGMEPDALRGAYQTISKHRPILWVEHIDYVTGRPDTKPQLLEIFEEHDYQTWKIHTPTFSPSNVRRETTSPFGEGIGDQNVLALPRGTNLPGDLEKMFYCRVTDFK